MKEITREKTITEVIRYEAIDGAGFDTKEACVEYEKSAKLVVCKELEPYKKGHMTPYDLYLGEGSEEYDIDIYYIPNAEILHKLNIYRTLVDPGEKKLIGEEYIGKIILLSWSYEHDYTYIMGTFEEIVEAMRKEYTKAMTPEEEKSE